jgi:hypothetical protein
VERLEEPIDAPVLAGSRPSRETIWSDAPEIVSVGPDGRLLAHRAGRAQVTARVGGPALIVVVRPRHVEPGTSMALAAASSPGLLSVKPARIRLKLGEIQAFEALTSAGPVASEWSTSNDQKVVHLQDHVFQGLELGTAMVCARAWHQRACSTVEVTP